jgi:hypothetical protein
MTSGKCERRKTQKEAMVNENMKSDDRDFII